LTHGEGCLVDEQAKTFDICTTNIPRVMWLPFIWLIGSRRRKKNKQKLVNLEEIAALSQFLICFLFEIMGRRANSIGLSFLKVALKVECCF
jgi:hypothetical protein